MVWITEVDQADIDSDLSVFHRIDAPEEMSGPRYLLLAERLGAYGGAVTARLARMQAEREPRPQVYAPAPEQQSRRIEKVAADAETLSTMTKQAGPGFPSIGYRNRKQ